MHTPTPYYFIPLPRYRARLYSLIPPIKIVGPRIEEIVGWGVLDLNQIVGVGGLCTMLAALLFPLCTHPAFAKRVKALFLMFAPTCACRIIPRRRCRTRSRFMSGWRWRGRTA